MTRDSFHLDRRRFLQVGGAVASIELDPAALAPTDDRTAEHELPKQIPGEAEPADGRHADLARYADSLPAVERLHTDAHVQFSLTRLDVDAAALIEPDIESATALGTVFAGRTGVDVAFDVTESDLPAERFNANTYDRIGSHRGTELLHQRSRDRHRVVAVTDAIAVVGVGPIRETVVHDVTATLDAAKTDRPHTMADDATVSRVLDRLGDGFHVSVDRTPDPRRTASAVNATGEVYQFDDDGLTARTVTHFETRGQAHAATRDDIATMPIQERAPATDRATRVQGRSIVDDATLEPDVLRDHP